MTARRTIEAQGELLPPGTLVSALLESPQHYPGDVVYQKDSRFGTISPGNLASYEVLGSDSRFLYTLNPKGPTGYVFAAQDVEHGSRLGYVPVMHVSLRDEPITGYKQAHHLRIRESYARAGAAMGWYIAYVAQNGGIVSDFEHLEGGRVFWRAIVNRGADRGMRVSLLDANTGQRWPVGPDTPDDAIWSDDKSGRNLLIVLEL